MPSYVVTGVSRGLGWEFLNQLSSDSHNTVIGIVRNKPATEKWIAEEPSGRLSITILEADLTNYDAIKKAAADTASITGGKLDYLIANAALVSQYDAYSGLGDFDPDELTAQFRLVMDTIVLSTIHLYNLFIAQIFEGKVKKAVSISSGMGDMDWVRDYDLETSDLYGASKAALNMIDAKFSAQYKKDGVLFLSVCPGMVEVGHFNDLTPEKASIVGAMLAKFASYAPDFKGPDAPPDSIRAVLSVVEKSSIENGDGGAFVSHFGKRPWI